MSKIQIYFKSPDAVSYAIDDYLDSLNHPEDWDANDIEEFKEDQTLIIQSILNKFFQYGESVIIEVDLKEKTARVVPRDED